MIKDNTALLQYIYQNAKIGSKTYDNIKFTLPIGLRKILLAQQKEYNKLLLSVTKELVNDNSDIEETRMICPIVTYTSLKNNQLNDDKYLVKVLKEVCLLGLSDIPKMINKYQSANKNTINLSNKLLSLEKNTLNKLEKITV